MNTVNWKVNMLFRHQVIIYFYDFVQPFKFVHLKMTSVPCDQLNSYFDVIVHELVGVEQELNTYCIYVNFQ